MVIEVIYLRNLLEYPDFAHWQGNNTLVFENNVANCVNLKDESCYLVGNTRLEALRHEIAQKWKYVPNYD